MDISIVEIDPQLVLGIRKEGPYKSIAQIIPELFEYMQNNGIDCVGSPVYVCHESTPEEAKKAVEEGNADLEVVAPIDYKVEGQQGYKCYELEGGKMAKIVHKGPYDQSGSTYTKLFAWIAENDVKTRGCIREVYVNDPREVSPEEILTEIYTPIE